MFVGCTILRESENDGYYVVQPSIAQGEEVEAIDIHRRGDLVPGNEAILIQAGNQYGVAGLFHNLSSVISVPDSARASIEAIAPANVACSYLAHLINRARVYYRRARVVEVIPPWLKIRFFDGPFPNRTISVPIAPTQGLMASFFKPGEFVIVNTWQYQEPSVTGWWEAPDFSANLWMGTGQGDIIQIYATDFAQPFEESPYTYLVDDEPFKWQFPHLRTNRQGQIICWLWRPESGAPNKGRFKAVSLTYDENQDIVFRADGPETVAIRQTNPLFFGNYCANEYSTVQTTFPFLPIKKMSIVGFSGEIYNGPTPRPIEPLAFQGCYGTLIIDGAGDAFSERVARTSGLNNANFLYVINTATQSLELINMSFAPIACTPLPENTWATYGAKNAIISKEKMYLCNIAESEGAFTFQVVSEEPLTYPQDAAAHTSQILFSFGENAETIITHEGRYSPIPGVLDDDRYYIGTATHRIVRPETIDFTSVARLKFGALIWPGGSLIE